MSNRLADRIVELLAASPGLTTRQIAGKLHIEEKRKVSQCLYGRIKSEVVPDDKYRWYLLADAPEARVETGGRVPSRTPSTGSRNEPPDTPLARLCRYYLDCLAFDDSGAEVFATSRHELSYCELGAWPFGGYGDVAFSSPPVRDLVARATKSRSEVLYFGYPVLLRRIRNQRGTFTFFVTPLFLFSCDPKGGPKPGVPAINGDLPAINQRALRGLPMTTGAGTQEEAIRLTEALGLDAGLDPADFDDVVHRLRADRADWPWVEEPDPHELNADPLLSDASAHGIYNRAVLMLTERPPFTLGLESELNKLMRLKRHEYADTALGSWLAGHGGGAATPDEESFLEVLPLNQEQRTASQRGLTEGLTVVTGPPGTGKSQVVTSLLVNASLRETKVLFASKNHKAVDVVEDRVNGLGTRPVLLRLGTQEQNFRLAEYLSKLLSAAPDGPERAQYREARQSLGRLLEQDNTLDAEARSVIDLRNATDRLEAAADLARRIFGDDAYRSLGVCPAERRAAMLGDVAAVLRAVRRYRG